MNSNPYTQRNVRLGALHYLMGRGAAGLAGFLVVLLLVRYMDVGNYAAYTALSGLVALCGILSGLGMERVVSRYVPEGRLYHSVEELSRFIWMTSTVRLMAALLVTLLLAVFWPEIDRFLSVAQFQHFSTALVCFIVAEAMFQHFSSILQSLVMQKTLTQLLVIQWAGRLLLIIGFVAVQSHIDWEDSLWIFAIPELVGVLGFVVVIQRHLADLSRQDGHVPVKNDWPAWGSVAETGLHNYGFTLLAAPPQGYFMKVLSAAYLPVEVVAAYGFFLSVAEKVRQYIPLHFFYGLLEPMMIAGYLKDKDFPALSYRCQLLYKSNLLLMVPAIAWVAVAGDEIVGLITGGKFQGLSWILLLIMVQLTVGSHVVLLQLLLNSLEKSRVLVVASMVALPAMVTAMLLAVAISPYWLLGTPLLFSLVMNLYIVYQLARGHHPYKPSWQMLGGVSMSGGVAFFVVAMLQLALPWHTTALVTTIATLLGTIILYSVAIRVSNTITKSETELIKGIILNIRQSKAGAL